MARRPAGPIEIAAESDLPVVQTHRSDSPVTSNEKAQYATSFRQRVEKQTQATRRGPLRLGKGNASDIHLGDGPAAGHDLRSLMAVGSSPQAVSDDVALGDQTVLNTDSVVYASFLNRVAEEIYEPWYTRANEAVTDAARAGRPLGAREYITRLEVNMDELGRVTALRVLKSCGVEALDEAPKQAFWDRDPFPNPPDQLRQSGGEYQIVYEFHYELKSSKFSIVPAAI